MADHDVFDSDEAQKICMGHLFTLRENAVYTWHAHLEEEKRLENLRSFGSFSKVLAAVLVVCMPICIWAFGLCNAYLVALIVAAGIFLLADYVEKEVRSKENLSKTWANEWSNLYNNANLLSYSIESGDVGRAYYLARIKELDAEKARLDKESIRTNSPSYTSACEKLNRFWYDQEARRFNAQGWDGNRCLPKVTAK